MKHSMSLDASAAPAARPTNYRPHLHSQSQDSSHPEIDSISGQCEINTPASILEIDLDQARRYLVQLTGTAETSVTFQTFPDNKTITPNAGALTKILHGSLSAHAAELTRLNKLGAGIFIVVNETDLKGRKSENVVRVRALFADFDDAAANPTELVARLQPEPHIVVESSPGKIHAYWRVTDCALDDFGAMQSELALKLGSDTKVKDLPRVMRLPGFLHRKSEPALTRITSVFDSMAYTLAEIKRGLLQIDAHGVKKSAIQGKHPHVNDDTRPKPPAPVALDRQREFNRLGVLSGVAEGSRDDRLFRLACSYRAKNWSYEEAKILVLAAAANCNPPFPDQEALEKLDQAWKYAGDSSPEKLTELGNARRLVVRHGSKLRWVTEFKKWLHWDGDRWLFDETEEVMRCAKETSRSIYTEVGLPTDSKVADAFAKHASKSQSLRMLNAMIELARTEPETPISQSHLDSNPMLLGVTNGVVNLATGTLNLPVPGNYITKQAHATYDTASTCPTWERFLSTIMGGNTALVSYLQRAVGYSLTGSTADQCLFFLYGTGRNGKSTFLGALKDLLGEYASQCSAETLMVKSKDGGVNNDIARLRGARFVSTIEAEEGKRLAESLVKQLTGGDPIVARFLFKEYFEFRPQFKIWLAANHKPIIRGDDFAIWRRIRLIPFTVTIPEIEIDKELPAKLAAESAGILSWAITGCLEWQKSGLQPPAEVINATETYRGEMDVFGAWLEECCTVAPPAYGAAKVLYDSYRKWCEEAGGYPLSQVKFALKLAERGFEKTRNSTGLVYHGIQLQS